MAYGTGAYDEVTSSDSVSSIRLESSGSPIAADSQYTSSDEEADIISLTPSVTNYPMRWGRRYHKYKEGLYLLPNDESESNRLDFQHAILKSLHGGRLFFAPLRDPRRILDIGTGTGIWPIELADSGLVPNARITGTDLSPIQPSDVPEGVQFEIADCTERDWCRPKDSLDLVHMRMMVSALTDFPGFMTTAKKYLKPGVGWLELHDVDPRPKSDDDTIPHRWPFSEWEKMMSRGAKKVNPKNSIHGAPKLRQWMTEAGYVDVREVIHKMPLGSWPKNKELKQLGRAYINVLVDGLPGFSYKILGNEGLGLNRAEIEVRLADVRKSLLDRDVHAYINFHTVYGRRPAAGEVSTPTGG